ncbi:MAG: hypothetical protein LBC18_15480, partial [Opitutaceae bacterium]|nr:hypothetical protein [Opitutaceae bacterium]
LPKGAANFASSPAGLRAFFARLPENARVVCEATGRIDAPLIARHARHTEEIFPQEGKRGWERWERWERKKKEKEERGGERMLPRNIGF